MNPTPHPRRDPYYGIFSLGRSLDGRGMLHRHPHAPSSLPDPRTGHQLKIATVEVTSTAICPGCAERSQGGFISFEADLRMVYACPECRQLVWLHGV